jgi:hypothetical protein
MENLPREIWINILANLNNEYSLDNLLVVRRVCTDWRQIFGNAIRDLDINLRQYSNIKDDNLKLFRGIRKISLWGCRQITDKGLSNLQPIDSAKTIRYIDLTYCEKITDEGIVYLEGVTDIILNGCYISNWALDYLKDVKSISWDNCSIISDIGLTKFTNLQKVNILGGRISDDGLANLEGVKEVNISLLKITDDGIYHLRNADKVILHSCPGITNNGLLHLKNVRKVYINYCNKITKECLLNSNPHYKIKLWPI